MHCRNSVKIASTLLVYVFSVVCGVGEGAEPLCSFICMCFAFVRKTPRMQNCPRMGRTRANSVYFFVSPFELFLKGPLRPTIPKDLGGAGRFFKITHRIHFIIVYVGVFCLHKNLTSTFTLMSKTRVIGQCQFWV